MGSRHRCLIASRVPFIGSTAVHMMLGGPIIAGATLSRFFAFHVFVIPGILLVLACLHVWMVLKLGINEWPIQGVLFAALHISRNTMSSQEGRSAIRAGRGVEGCVLSAAILAAVAVCAAVLGPYGPSGPRPNDYSNCA